MRHDLHHTFCDVHTTCRKLHFWILRIANEDSQSCTLGTLMPSAREGPSGFFTHTAHGREAFISFRFGLHTWRPTPALFRSPGAQRRTSIQTRQHGAKSAPFSYPPSRPCESLSRAPITHARSSGASATTKRSSRWRGDAGTSCSPCCATGQFTNPSQPLMLDERHRGAPPGFTTADDRRDGSSRRNRPRPAPAAFASCPFGQYMARLVLYPSCLSAERLEC
ncbi:hypothetical protein BW21_2625 [Burkholderia humptydooensis]|nr:hypothetical protein BW21_2625 [Burkholderia sp. 2002721687]